MDTGPSEVIPINIGLISLGPVSMLIVLILNVLNGLDCFVRIFKNFDKNYKN